MRVEVPRLEKAPKVDGVWEKEPWSRIPHLSLARAMGEPPVHRPDVRVKVAYDPEAVFLVFRVEDRYVRAVATEYQGRVWEDSCVEFFFTPGTDLREGYFNLEMNCGGTALFHHQKERGRDVVPVAEADFNRLQVAASLPQVVDPELEGPVTWTVEVRLPVEVLEKYAPLVRPGPGAVWRGNFYKCAEKTSRPHWLTWAPVGWPRPNFHLPEFFGELEFR